MIFPVLKRYALPLQCSIILALGLAQHFSTKMIAGADMVIPVGISYYAAFVETRLVKNFLGLNLMVADLIWIDTMIRADIARENKPFTDLYKAFDTIVSLDPDNYYAYYAGGIYLSVIKEDPQGATALLTKGSKRVEEVNHLGEARWRLPFTLGYHLLIEEQKFEEGSEWIVKAGQVEGSNWLVKKLAERASTPSGRREIAARVLTEIYRNTDDPERKKIIEKKLTDVSVEQEVWELNEKFKTFCGSKTIAESKASPAKLFSIFLKKIGHSGKDQRGKEIRVDQHGVLHADQP